MRLLLVVLVFFACSAAFADGDDATGANHDPSPDTTDLADKRLYKVESADDRTFVIDGEVYKAKARCHNFADTGDRVQFVSGNARSCVSATLFNPRNDKLCNVWCK